MASAAFSPIMYTALAMKKPGMRGKTEASTTRSPSTPWTRKSLGEHAAVLAAADAAGTRRVVAPGVPPDEIRQLRIADAVARQLLGGDEPFGLQS